MIGVIFVIVVLLFVCKSLIYSSESSISSEEITVSCYNKKGTNDKDSFNSGSEEKNNNIIQNYEILSEGDYSILDHKGNVYYKAIPGYNPEKCTMHLIDDNGNTYTIYNHTYENHVVYNGIYKNDWLVTLNSSLYRNASSSWHDSNGYDEFI